MLPEGDGFQHIGVLGSRFSVLGYNMELEIGTHGFGTKTPLVITGLVSKTALDDMLAGR